MFAQVTAKVSGEFFLRHSVVALCHSVASFQEVEDLVAVAVAVVVVLDILWD